MSKRIFILDGHPAETSLNRALAENYAEAARAVGHTVRMAHLSDLNFAIDRKRAGYDEDEHVEAHLTSAFDSIQWAEHIVLTTPIWWGGVPAKLKGLFDQILIPGSAFEIRESGLPKGMLQGRSARVLMTSDTPDWVLRFVYGNPLPKQIKHQIFGFVGIKPTRFTHFSGVSNPKPGTIDRWLKQAKALGSRAA